MQGKVLVETDDSLKRTNDINRLLGDSSKVRNEINWSPKLNIQDIISEMYQTDFLSLYN